MNVTLVLQTMITILLSIYLLVLIIKNWNNLPLLLLPLIWYLPEQTSPGRLLENYIFFR